MTISEQYGKKEYPFQFDPKACGKCPARCCRGRSGNVWINAGEMQQILKYLEINTVDAMQRFFHKKENRIIIREKYDGNEFLCVFLDEEWQCSIYPVRPIQCGTFPFWEYYKEEEHLPMLRRDCPGVQGGVSSIRKL